jgi:hypothetical protein
MEQLRIQGIDIRNRPIPATAAASARPAEPGRFSNMASASAAGAPADSSASATAVPPATASIEINPEFLAALPPQIQEELLQQQRIEQQARVAASTAGTEGTN